MLVEFGMHVQNGYWPCGVAGGRHHHAATIGCNGGNFIGQFAGEAVAKHAAVGVAGGVHFFGIDFVIGQQFIYELADEFYIVHFVVHGGAAAAAGIPGVDDAGTIGVHHNETGSIGFGSEVIGAFELGTAATAAVQGYHQRQIAGFVVIGGQVDSVSTGEAIYLYAAVEAVYFGGSRCVIFFAGGQQKQQAGEAAGDLVFHRRVNENRWVRRANVRNV